ncbi:interleukin-36 beta isoform X1 [Nycticebus coucang]|uniref:interleukin-36 beta isoform X1 n=1 Tax=Nycticebus coucang TaxID=9470 RepID=UPI00234C7B5F|nr:interleukin-36 beta isoform X1 [Nycticebus coucang]
MSGRKDWTSPTGSLTSSPFSLVFLVTLGIVTCRDTEFHNEEKGNMVYLEIKGKTLYLFCEEIQGKPTLQLKEKKIMELLEEKAQKPFLFFHNKEGSTSVFESVAYPGRFIATPPTAGQVVTLTQERDITTNTNFYG